MYDASRVAMLQCIEYLPDAMTRNRVRECQFLASVRVNTIEPAATHTHTPLTTKLQQSQRAFFKPFSKSIGNCRAIREGAFMQSPIYYTYMHTVQILCA